MECYYHPSVPAVGTCSQCGKAACRRCIQDVGGALLCRDCVALAQQQLEQEARSEAEYARRCIRNSWFVACLGPLFGLFIAEITQNTIAAIAFSVLYFYVFWSTYWGFKWLWPKWKSFAQRFPILIMPLTYWGIVFMILWEIAGTYGMFGGAIVQYRKFRTIASRRD